MHRDALLKLHRHADPAALPAVTSVQFCSAASVQLTSAAYTGIPLRAISVQSHINLDSESSPGCQSQLLPIHLKSCLLAQQRGFTVSVPTVRHAIAVTFSGGGLPRHCVQPGALQSSRSRSLRLSEKNMRACFDHRTSSLAPVRLASRRYRSNAHAGKSFNDS